MTRWEVVVDPQDANAPLKWQRIRDPYDNVQCDECEEMVDAGAFITDEEIDDPEVLVLCQRDAKAAYAEDLAADRAWEDRYGRR